MYANYEKTDRNKVAKQVMDNFELSDEEKGMAIAVFKTVENKWVLKVLEKVREHPKPKPDTTQQERLERALKPLIEKIMRGK